MSRAGEHWKGPGALDPAAVARGIVRAGDSAAVVGVSREPEPEWQKYRLSPMATVTIQLPAEALIDPPDSHGEVDFENDPDGIVTNPSGEGVAERFHAACDGGRSPGHGDSGDEHQPGAGGAD